MHHDDFKFEPVRGLPEALPKGEHILWQGSPDPRRLVRDAWKLNWVLGYFGVLIVWRVMASLASAPLTEALGHAIPLALLALLATAILYGMAWVQAKATVYTLTNRRVALRIGAALTMTLNLPYVCIANANLAEHKSGHGTLALDLTEGGARVSYLMTWPHVRPWRFTPAQPALRSIPHAARVAAIFAEAAETRVTEPRLTRVPATQSAIAAE